MQEQTLALNVVAAAEEALTKSLGGPVRLQETEVLRKAYRNSVLRCAVVEAPPEAPASVIIKASVGEEETVFDPDRDLHGDPAWRFYNEWAGTRFLNDMSASSPVCARLLAGNRDAGVIVLEDLGTGKSLSDLLQGDDFEAAKNGLERYAASMGRLHAVTAGKEAAWRHVRSDIGGREAVREREGARWLRDNVPPFRAQCAALDIPLAAGFDAETEQVREILDDPGPFLVFAPGDTCPDNHRFVDDHYVRFFDFEFAGFQHALLDASYLRVPFPTCWCVNRLPWELVSHLETVYRAELIQGCPEAGEDKYFFRALVAVCAYWTVDSVGGNLESALKRGR